MKMAEQVMDAMSMIDESYLRQSEEYKASSFAWKPVLSFAAVFILICAVFFNIPRSGSSAPATNGFLTVNDSAVSEESVYESENIAVIYDNELLEYLETVSDDTAVAIIIEEVDAKAAEVQTDSLTGSETMDADSSSVTTMTKAEILNFIAEEGKHYIFHLYTADESE